ncbi:MAG: glycosyltransferase involved in cell wall biosynthesis [Myxococcota bacterium]|jgi:glycosyltransferase involved in cell wall biosynthesis
MRILQVLAGFDERWGGPAKVVRELSARLSDRGHEVTIMATNALPGGAQSDAPLEATGSYALETFGLDLARPPYPSTALARAVWTKAKHYDVAHLHGLFNLPVTSAALALSARRVPYVVRTCGMLDQWSLTQKARSKRVYLRMLERGTLNRAARIQVSTPFEADEVAHLGLRTPIAVHPQGVAPPPRWEGEPPERPFVLFLSRIALKKGLVPLLRAFAQVAARFPDHDLVIAGPDEFGHQAVVEAEARALGLGDRVRFPGMVRGADKGRLYGQASCFALTSHDENFGIVVIEAAQCGCPLLLTPGVGLASAVAEHGAGEIVDLEVNAIAEGLVRVLEKGRAAYAAQTRALGDAFHWDVRTEAIERMYADVLAGR